MTVVDSYAFTPKKGVTLAELLIALAVLGIIAVFSVPKIMQVVADPKQHIAITKEAAAMVSGAYEAYAVRNVPNENTHLADLVPFMNTIGRDTTAMIDASPSQGSIDCSDPMVICLRLYNGGMIWFQEGERFNGTGVNNAVSFDVDPDGVDNDIEGVNLYLYFNKRVRSFTNIDVGTTGYNSAVGAWVFNPDPALDPPWFRWN